MKRNILTLMLSSNLAVGMLCYWLGSRADIRFDQPSSTAPLLTEPVSLLSSSAFKQTAVPRGVAHTPQGSPSLRPHAAASDGLRHRLATLMQRVETMGHKEVLASLKEIRYQPDSPDKQLAQQVLLARYGELDPETALTYVGTLVGEDYEAAARTVVSAWTDSDPAANYYLETQDDFGMLDEQLKGMAGSVAAEWARQDPDAALDWATELPPEVSGEAYGRIAAELVRQDPAKATAALSTMEAGFERTEMLETLVDQWAYQDPKSAADWALSNTSGDDQLRAVTSLMDAWMTTDPMSASTWIANIDNGAIKDSAILALTQSRAVARDPEAAAAWTAAIQDQQLRESIQAQLATP